MEKILKVSSRSGKDYRFEWFEWRFTEDEKENLRDILQGFDPLCINEFTLHLEYLCNRVWILSDEETAHKRPSKEGRKVAILETIANLEKARSAAQKIKRGMITPFMPYGFEEPSDYDWVASLEEAHSLSWGIDRQIGQLIDILKGSPDLLPKRGNPTIRNEFATAIADAYSRHLGRPTTTHSSPNPHINRFCNILSFAFEATGLPSEDVSKVARAAVCPKRGYKTQRKN